ncbi:MAG TPA: prolyl oligopeptidase family serine peptidase, partial [Vicinamibacterales bacterium]|nr:prolyl oligopeptidase family serine peptidase [Vicinamibacterales bacterium]
MKTARYGSWKSPITSDLIVARSIGLSEVLIDGADIYWLESRPQEAGRNVVVRRGHRGPADVNPRPFNVRSRVHEYGGGAWFVADGTLYFSNDGPGENGLPDRRLYRQDRGAMPVPITPLGAWRYADGIIDRRRRRWIGVREDHTAAGEPVNTIVAVGLTTSEPRPGRVLASGHDFFSSPRLSPDGRHLVWLAWDHPNMPWMGTTLYLAELADDGAPSGSPTAIAGGDTESIVQPEWSPDGSCLLFVSDRTGWWNLYRYDLSARRSEPLAPMAAEFARAQWTFGNSTYAFAGPKRVVCTSVSNGLGRLALIDLNSGKFTAIDTPYTEFSSMRADGDRAVFRAGAPGIASSIVSLDLRSGSLEILNKSTDLIEAFGLARYLTAAQPIEFPTEGGKISHGLYYPPCNPDYAGPPGEQPPLVVKCHGGPTAAASTTLDLRTQYWTSRGIAVLDVNYGGSTGYGRAYRERLQRAWGVVDVDDCVNGARFLAEQGMADGQRCVITGSSAGGYTVLAALTFRDYFAGGASHYGVSELAALARDTHKFESRYLDWLIGAYPEDEAVYRAR